jgi:hypothetical protein
MRPDWRDTVRAAADLALLGILLTLAGLPVVTAGGAVATAARAVHHFAHEDGWPRATDLGRTFVRALLPGLGPTLLVFGAVALFALDLAALRTGRVPGGEPMLALTGVLAAGAAGFGALVVGLLPRAEGWRAAARSAAALVAARPAALAAATGLVALATALTALLHPVLAPMLAGYTLYAAYALAVRFTTSTVTLPTETTAG